MKKIVILLLVFVISIIGIGCSNSEPETYDQDFLKSISTGLEERWKLNDEYDKLIKDEKLSEKEGIEYYKKFVKVELDNVEKYKDLNFEDSKLQELAISYINCLKQQQEALEYVNSNFEKFQSLWDEAYKERSKIIANLNENYELTISDNYKDTLQDVDKVSTQTKEYEKIEEKVKNTKFKMVSSSYGWKDYKAIIENTTSCNFEYFSININLIDKDGVIVESTFASVNNWKAGQKAKFEFSTDKDFETMSYELDYSESN